MSHAQCAWLDLQIFDLTHGRSNSASGLVEFDEPSDDLLALAAAVCMYIKLHFSPQQRYPRRFAKVLTAFAALLVRRQPEDVPELHNAYTIYQVVHTELRMLQQLGYERTIPTPMNWIDIHRQRKTLRQ